MDIILFGMQGSGKGTQGKILAEKYGLRVFDMGSELRHAVESGSPLGLTIKNTIEQGHLVEDALILQVVEQFIASVSSETKILFDGIPRTIGQADKLLELLHHRGREAFALYIKISETEAMERLTKRRVCQGCKTIYPAFYESEKCGECGGPLITRKDDNAEAIRQRLASYQQETVPVINRFHKVDHLIEVDGEQSIPDVTEEMIDKAAYLFT